MTNRGDRRWPRAASIELVQDLSAISSATQGYLRRHRHRLKTVFDDGTRSDVYTADYMDRDEPARDAAAIAVFCRAKQIADTEILLRRQVRYGIYVREQRPLTTEVLAGLIEGDEPVEACAMREAREEASLEISADKVIKLGRPCYILPGIFTEKIVPVAIEVSPEQIRAAVEEPPPGDGSPFEQGSEVIIMTLGEIFERIETPPPSGDRHAIIIDDAKTELVLTRLWRHLEGGG